MNAKTEQLVLEENNLYRDSYRRTLSVLTIMIVVCMVLSAVLAYQVVETPKPNYYATTTTGRVAPLQPLSMPVVTHHYLLQWASLATRSAYNLNFVDYQKQLKNSSAYFTPDGWQSLMSAMKDSGVLTSLKENKLYMSAVVSGTPVILDEKLVEGRYTWRIQLPLLVTYTSASEARKLQYVVTMDVMRVPVLDAEKGIQINNFSVAG